MATDDAKNFGRPPLNHRAFQRGEVSITASIREHGGGRQQVEIVDLSRTGFRMKTASFVPEGRIIFLTLPGYAPLEARIAWHRQELYGCKFELRLHEAIYDHIVQNYPHLGRRD